ncbi:MAG: RluA family pseudouridine synthase [Anaerolineae bacterium]|nr:RluA family pseudouridine synthase [Phycisphaerae bacterium]
MPESPALKILFDDPDIVAVEKPAGLATIPGRDESFSVLHDLAAQLGIPATGTADPRLRVVHRLDKDTSGVLLFAKNTGAQRFLSEQFQNNTIQKEYLAIVAGRPGANEGSIDAALAPHPAHPKRMTVFKHGRRALTEWKLEQKFRDYALLRVFPKTGKTHQIRVHLSHISLPLVVDPLYNSPMNPDAALPPGLFLSSFKKDYRPNKDQIERPLIARLTLHAEKLTFKHPNGNELTIECPPPKDFRATLAQLAKTSR